MSTDNLDYFGDAKLNDATLEAWDGDFDRLPPGEYEFEVAKYERKTTQAGAPRLVMNLKVIAPASHAGKTAFHSFMLGGSDEKQTWRKRLKHFTTAIGIQCDAQGGFHFSSLVGKRFIATVANREEKKIDATTGAETAVTYSDIKKERALGSGPIAGIAGVIAGVNGAAKAPQTGPTL